MSEICCCSVKDRELCYKTFCSEFYLDKFANSVRVKNGSILASFLTYDSRNIKISVDWIQTTDLWCQK